MKTATALRKYYKTRIETLEEILAKPDKIVSAEDFHILRVEIKKLKAILALVDESGKDFKRKKFLKPFKKLFRQAGKVRDLQLEEAALKKIRLPASLKSYTAELKEQLKKEQEKFFGLLHEEGFKKLEKNEEKLLSHISHIGKKEVHRFEEAKQEEISSLFAKKDLKPGQVHALRKKVKALYYIHQLLPDKNGDSRKLEGFQELLGQWHDDVVLGQELQKAEAAVEMPPKEMQQMHRLRRNVYVRSRRLYKKIISEGGSLQNGN